MDVKVSMCVFLRAVIIFLVYEVDGEGIHIFYDKTTTVRKFPKPQSEDNVCSFLEVVSIIDYFNKNCTTQNTSKTV